MRGERVRRWRPRGRGQSKLALQPREVEESGFAAYGNSSSVHDCCGSGGG